MKRLFVGLIAVASVSGCSLDAPERNSNRFKIVIEDPNQNAAMAAPLLMGLVSSSGPRFGVLALPTSTSDFNCFAVNVTGPGVQGDSQKFQGCTSPSNMNGRGFGILSEPAQRGHPIELDIPSGFNRAISVYGIFPSNHIQECGGTNAAGGNGNPGGDGGYFLGEKIVNLSEAASVSIPISYTAGDGPTVTCTGGNNNGQLQVFGVFPYGGVSSASTAITINGANFQAGATVDIDGVPCNGVTVVNPGMLQCSVPTGLPNGLKPITVASSGQAITSVNPGFTVISGGAFLSLNHNTAFDFGNVQFGGAPKVVPFILTNTGSGSANISSVVVTGANAADFVYNGSGNCAPLGVLPNGGASCSFTITFTPGAASARSATATVVSGSMVVGLSGVGVP